MRRHTTVVRLLLPALGVLLLAGCGSRTVSIGFAGPLTGTYSDLGVQGRNGAMLAVEDLADAPCTEGYRFEILPRDDRNSPELAREIGAEFAELGVAAVVGHMTSTASIAALAVSDATGLVYVSPTASSPALSRRADSFFRVQGATDAVAADFGTFAGDTLGLARVHTIRDAANSVYGDPFNHRFIEAYRDTGGMIAEEIAFNTEGSPRWVRISEILGNGSVDGVLVIASARDTARIARIVREVAPRARILSSGWGATEELLSDGGDAVEGVIAGRAVARDNEVPEVRSFEASYRARFGRTPSFAAVQAYDATRVLCRALAEAGSAPRALGEALLGIQNFPGIYGPISFDEFGDVVSSTAILRVRDGRFEPYGSVQAESDD